MCLGLLRGQESIGDKTREYSTLFLNTEELARPCRMQGQQSAERKGFFINPLKEDLTVIVREIKSVEY